jgi:hypothetical protein
MMGDWMQAYRAAGGRRQLENRLIQELHWQPSKARQYAAAAEHIALFGIDPLTGYTDVDTAGRTRLATAESSNATLQNAYAGAWQRIEQFRRQPTNDPVRQQQLANLQRLIDDQPRDGVPKFVGDITKFFTNPLETIQAGLDRVTAPARPAQPTPRRQAQAKPKQPSPPETSEQRKARLIKEWDALYGKNDTKSLDRQIDLFEALWALEVYKTLSPHATQRRRSKWIDEYQAIARSSNPDVARAMALWNRIHNTGVTPPIAETLRSHLQKTKEGQAFLKVADAAVHQEDAEREARIANAQQADTPAGKAPTGVSTPIGGQIYPGITPSSVPDGREAMLMNMTGEEYLQWRAQLPQPQPELQRPKATTQPVTERTQRVEIPGEQVYPGIEPSPYPNSREAMLMNKTGEEYLQWREQLPPLRRTRTVEITPERSTLGQDIGGFAGGTLGMIVGELINPFGGGLPGAAIGAALGSGAGDYLEHREVDEAFKAGIIDGTLTFGIGKIGSKFAGPMATNIAEDMASQVPLPKGLENIGVLQISRAERDAAYEASTKALDQAYHTSADAFEHTWNDFVRTQYNRSLARVENWKSREIARGADKATIAKQVSDLRYYLRAKYQILTTDMARQWIAQRNNYRYDGHPVGPTFEYLKNVKLRTFDEILESATRSGGKDMRLTQ